MELLSWLQLIKYCLVMLYGLFLSAGISGGWKDCRQRNTLILLCPSLLLLQGVCLLFLGTDAVWKLYPLIVHMPLVLVLIIVLKKPVGVAVVSVCIGYLCCQFPRWAELTVLAVTESELVGLIGYIVCIIPVGFLLNRWFVRAAYSAMCYSRRSLLLFGSLPLAYYVFDYGTSIYSDALYVGVQAVNEFLPTVLMMFYVLFLTAYHVQAQERSQAELQSSLLEAELKQSRAEMESLRRAETQTAIYQHDMRHHLTAISGLLDAGNSQQAAEYIRTVQSDVETITPRQFCAHETVNLLCSSFYQRAKQAGVALKIMAKLPEGLPISDAELCAVVSNGLENALRAVTSAADVGKWVDFYCEVKHNKLLIEIRNPYSGKVDMEQGLPVSRQTGHGFGCRSIRSIANRHRGLCSFEPVDGLFTLRVVLPL